MSKEFKIGLITIIAGGLLYYGFNFLRGSDLFSSTNRYYVVYPNVAGLTVSNPVLFNGLNVGRVSGLNLEQAKNRIVVSIDVDASFFVGKLDTASLANNDFFGTKAIIIYQGSGNGPLLPGDTLKSKIAGDLLSQLEPVADNLNTTITKLNALLDELNSTDISGVVDTLKYSIGAITNKVNRLNVEEPIKNVNNVLVSFKNRSDQLEGIFESSQVLIDSLNKLPLSVTLVKLHESMDQVNSLLASIQSDEGSLGKMLSSDSIYNNLNKLLVDMDELIIHFNNYPKDFMKPLGRKHKKLKGVSTDTEEED